MDDLIEKLDYIENNNSEGNQRTFVFEMISSDVNNTLNICWNGNYGLEYRINRTSLAIPLGYMELNDANSYYPFNSEGLVPDTPEFKPLIDYTPVGIDGRGIDNYCFDHEIPKEEFEKGARCWQFSVFVPIDLSNIRVLNGQMGH
jgi:hypothetical protein